MSNKNRTAARPTQSATLTDLAAAKNAAPDTILTAPEPVTDDADDDEPTDGVSLSADADAVIETESASVLPFGRVLFAPMKNPKTFIDKKSGDGSRGIIAGAVFFGDSLMALRFNIGVRWDKGSEDEAEPYMSLPNVGGRFNPALDTDDAETQNAFEVWKAETLKAGIDWLVERNKRQPNRAAAISVPATVKVSATALGLSLATPKLVEKSETK